MPHSMDGLIFKFFFLTKYQVKLCILSVTDTMYNGNMRRCLVIILLYLIVLEVEGRAKKKKNDEGSCENKGTCHNKDSWTSYSEQKNTRHYCDYCPKSFDTAQKLNQHMRDSHGVKSAGRQKGNTPDFKCEYCPKSFSTYESLQQHMRDKHKISDADSEVAAKLKDHAYKCNMCSKSFATHDRLLQHQRDKHGRRKNQRDKHGRMNDKQEKARTELETEVHTCYTCGQIFQRSESLRQHQRDTGHVGKQNRKKNRKNRVLHFYKEKVRVEGDDRKDSVQKVKNVIDSIVREIRKMEGGKIYSSSIRKAGSHAAKTKIGKAD